MNELFLNNSTKYFKTQIACFEMVTFTYPFISQARKRNAAKAGICLAGDELLDRLLITFQCTAGFSLIIEVNEFEWLPGVSFRRTWTLQRTKLWEEQGHLGPNHFSTREKHFIFFQWVSFEVITSQKWKLKAIAFMFFAFLPISFCLISTFMSPLTVLDAFDFHTLIFFSLNLISDFFPSPTSKNTLLAHNCYWISFLLRFYIVWLLSWMSTTINLFSWISFGIWIPKLTKNSQCCNCLLVFHGMFFTKTLTKWI